MFLNQCLAISLSQIVNNHSPSNEDEFSCTETNKQEQKPSSSASKLFRKLVERNCTALPEVRDALRKVEFAGFVVPSWLLLSGSYEDLHCIKTSWSEGNFSPPVGYKIETIGEYFANEKSGFIHLAQPSSKF